MMQRRHRPTYPRRPIVLNWALWPVPVHAELLAMWDEHIAAHEALVAAQLAEANPLLSHDDHATHLALRQEFTPHA